VVDTNPKLIDEVSDFKQSATIPSIEWYSTVGTEMDESLNSVVETTDGYFAAGWTTSSAGIKNVFLVKVDFEGNEVWNKTIEYGMNAEIVDVKETALGGFIMTGWIESATGDDILLVQVNANGNVIWSTIWGGTLDERAKDVIETPEGSFIVVGWSRSHTYGGSDLIIVHFNEEGIFQWYRHYGGRLEDEASSIIETFDGNYIVVGNTMSSGAALEHDIWMIKINPIGQPLWSRTFGGLDREYGTDIIKTNDYGFLLTGITESYLWRVL
jgi:hypothetical protein